MVTTESNIQFYIYCTLQYPLYKMSEYMLKGISSSTVFIYCNPFKTCCYRCNWFSRPLKGNMQQI